jgi:hypothetical protein
VSKHGGCKQLASPFSSGFPDQGLPTQTLADLLMPRDGEAEGLAPEALDSCRVLHPSGQCGSQDTERR